MDYLCEVYSNIAMSVTQNKQEHVFTPASYQYLRIIFVYVTRKENIQMRRLRPHLQGVWHRACRHGILPTHALPQLRQRPHHARLLLRMHWPRDIQGDMGNEWYVDWFRYKTWYLNWRILRHRESIPNRQVYFGLCKQIKERYCIQLTYFST